MGKDTFCLTGYTNLANAVVEQAAKDYRDALIKLDRSPEDIFAEGRMTECRNFFKNEIGMYTELDGEWLMKEIERRLHHKKHYRSHGK